MFFKPGPSFGKLYSVTAGIYAGQFLFFVEKTGDDYGFLAMPTMENRWIPKEKFDSAIKNCIVEFVEKPPQNVKKVAKAQFEENKKRV
jgi:hypothetical protein